MPTVACSASACSSVDTIRPGVKSESSRTRQRSENAAAAS